jgi:hypothetical protein
MTTTPRRITATLAVVLAVATGAGPVWARPFNLNGNGSYIPVAVGSAHAVSPVTAGGVTAGTSPTIVRVTTHDSGFDWGDAGIGAAGGVAVVVIALGGALVVSGQRRGRARSTKTVVS